MGFLVKLGDNQPVTVIGAIWKKVISYQTGRFIKESQELTLNKRINKFFN